MSTVSDSSPLIGLHAIGSLELLLTLFGDLIVPPAVDQEIRSFPLPTWITVRALPRPELARDLRHNLGPGEREAIGLAIQLPADRIVLDDAAAPSAARAHDLRVVGVLGILLSAKQLGILSSVREDVEALISASFHVSPRVYRNVLPAVHPTA